MRSIARLLLLAAFLLFAALPLLAGTKIVHHWVRTGQPLPAPKKILIAAVMENYLVRQEFEDEMNRQLAPYGVEGIPSYLVLPPRNELMEGELKQRIQESSLDGVLVVEPKAVRKERKEVVTHDLYVPPPAYSQFWPYGNSISGEVNPGSSFTQENLLVRAEFNLYSTKEDLLVWNGESETVYSKNFERLGKQYARALVNQLKKDRIIRKK